MPDKKELLKAAFTQAVDILPPATMKDSIEKAVLATEMKAFALAKGIEFTDEEISEEIAKGLADLANAKDYGRPVDSAAKPSTLSDLFLKAVELFPPAILDADIEEDVFATKIKALAEEENLKFTDEEIAEAIAEGLKALKRISQDFEK